MPISCATKSRWETAYPLRRQDQASHPLRRPEDELRVGGLVAARRGAKGPQGAAGATIGAHLDTGQTHRAQRVPELAQRLDLWKTDRLPSKGVVVECQRARGKTRPTHAARFQPLLEALPFEGGAVVNAELCIDGANEPKLQWVPMNP